MSLSWNEFYAETAAFTNATDLALSLYSYIQSKNVKKKEKEKFALEVPFHFSTCHPFYSALSSAQMSFNV